VAGVDRLDRRHLSRATPAGLGGERLGPEDGEVGSAGGVDGVDQRVAAEDGRADLDLVAVDLPRHAVGQHREIEPGRQPADHVAAVVAGAEDDGVGLVLGDEFGQGGGGRRADEGVAGVDGVDGGGAVLPQRPGQPVGIGTGVEGLDRAGHLPGLGQQLEGEGRGLAGRVGLGEDPYLVECHGCVIPSLSLR